MLASRWRYYARSVLPMLGASRSPARLVAGMLGARRGGFVRELRTGERFRVRSALDAWVVKETWLDRFYEEAGTPLEPGWNVVDIGAGVGDFAVLAAQACAPGRVLAIEPAEHAFALLEEILRPNAVTGVTTCRAAVGAPGDALGMREGRTSARSRSSPAAPLEGSVRPVRTVPLGDALDLPGVETCDLVKMDVEGAEERILLGARAEKIRRSRRFVLEVREEDAPGRGAERSRLFARLGYAVRTTPNPAWPALHWLYASRAGQPGEPRGRGRGRRGA